MHNQKSAGISFTSPLSRKMQCMSGICAEKALEQFLCEWFHYSSTMHIFILTDQIPVQTQILRSRDFDEDMADIFFTQMHSLD